MVYIKQYSDLNLVAMKVARNASQDQSVLAVGPTVAVQKTSNSVSLRENVYLHATKDAIMESIVHAHNNSQSQIPHIA